MKTKTITVILMLCLVVCAGFAQQKKETIAVMTLKGASGITKDETELLSDRLRAEFFKTGMVDVMEREQMAEILKEQGFQQSGACTNESCLIEMGQILGVQKLVSGSIGKIGSMYLLNLRLIDIKTAKISKTVSEDVKGDLEEVVERLARVARDLCKQEPVAPKSAPQASEKKESRRETSLEETREQASTEPSCDKRAFIEMTPFEKSSIGFEMEETDWREAYEKLADKLSDYIKPGVDTASRGALEKAQQCRAFVIRPQLESYSTRPARFGQKEGMMRMTFSFFESPSATEPALKMTVDAIGERHWKDAKPFINACEEMGKQLGKQLEKSGDLDRINGKK
jgi:TolB-like protein